jgi:glycosyltransferase involved in cell wall biosynthesis
LSSRSDVEAIEIVSFRREISRQETVAVNDKLLVHYVPGQRRGVKVTRAWGDYLRAKAIAVRFQPSVVHGQGLLVEGEIATRLGFPSVVTVHGMPQIEARLREKASILGWVRVQLVDQLARRVLGRAGTIVSLSDYDQRVLGGLVGSSMVRIPNPVRGHLLEGQQTAPEGSRILFAGAITPLKNVCGIISAFHKVRAVVPEACLELAGFAPDEEYLRKVTGEISRLGIPSLVYLGNLSGDELGAALRRAAMVVLFSDQENLPCIVAEAMACSRPVVSSSVGGVPEMIADGTSGFLVDAGDEEALAERLVRLLKDPELRRKMGERGHSIARARWAPATIADATMAAYRATLRSALAVH